MHSGTLGQESVCTMRMEGVQLAQILKQLGSDTMFYTPYSKMAPILVLLCLLAK